jgi:hypothetical protein
MATKRKDSIEEFQRKQKAKTGVVVSAALLRKEYVKRWRAEEKEMSKLVQCVINMGNILIEANPKTKGPKSLPHGEFESMVKEDFKMSPRTAHRLATIAKHPVLSNRTHVSDLPPSWGTLYELTRVPRPRLEAKLKDGTIHPAMERADVKPLLPKTRSNGKGKTKYKSDDDPEPETTASSSGEHEDEDDQTIWRRGLMFRAQTAVADAKFEDWSHFTIDDELIDEVSRAAAAWAAVEQYLKELKDG